MAEAATEIRGHRKVRTGLVTSKSGDKSIVVQVERRMQHPLYGKTVRQSKKYHAHDQNNEAAVGDTVRIAETRPYSKMKRWRLLEVVKN